MFVVKTLRFATIADLNAAQAAAVEVISVTPIVAEASLNTFENTTYNRYNYVLTAKYEE